MISSSFFTRCCGGVISAGILAFGLSASALEPAILKLHSADVNQKPSTYFGSSCAVSDKWVVVGEPYSKELGTETGNAQVFDRATGKYLRTLVSKDTAAGDLFGNSVAVSGNWALVSAPHSSVAASLAGAVYLFDLTTGKQVRRFTASDAAASDFFNTVVVSGNLVVVGAVGHSDVVLGANVGAVYVFDLTTGQQLRRITASNAVAGAYFGYNLAASGRLLLVTAAGYNSLTGAAYLYDLNTGAELHMFNASDATVGDFYGAGCALSGNRAVVSTNTAGKVYVYDTVTGAEVWKITGPLNAGLGQSVALSGNRLFAGAPYQAYLTSSSAGSIYIYDLATQSLVSQLSAPDHLTVSYFGSHLATYGGTLVSGVTHDTDRGLSTGAAYVFQNLAAPLPATTVAKTGDFAPSVPDAYFKSFNGASMNDQGEIAFGATLIGSGAPAGKTIGAWSTLKSSVSVSLLLRGGDVITTSPAVSVATVGLPLLNSNTYGLVQASLKGTGISAANDAVLYQDNTATLNPLLVENAAVPGGTGLLAAWPRVFQSRAPASNAVTVASYTLKTGKVGISAINDSGIVVFGIANNPAVVFNMAENTDALGTTVKFGQLSRLTYPQSSVIWTVGLQSEALTNQAVYVRAPNGPAVLTARKNDPAPQTTGAKFASFIGETGHPGNPSDFALIRATLTGGDTTALKNEGLWSTRSVNASMNDLKLVLRKGDPVPGLASVSFSAITGYWGISNNCVLIQAAIKGPGITAANDTGLWLAQEDGTLIPLLREGDAAPECLDGAKTGTIQQVEVDTAGGHYGVLISLVGGTAGKEQMLLTGNLLAGNATTLQALRLPAARLRKGLNCQSPLGATASLQSLSFPVPSTEATGAGGSGAARAINAQGVMVMTAIFSDKSVHMVTLKP